MSVDYGLLSRLPPIFHVSDLGIRLGLRAKDALTHLYYWKMRGHVLGLGGESGVYANLVADQYPDWELAVRKVMPTAVVIGIEVLRRVGWTTQIPYIPDIAVNKGQRVYRVRHFAVSAFPREWFVLMSSGIVSNETGALPYLSPAWALADLLKREGWCDCGLGPDDIYWDLINERDRQDWLNACSTLHLEPALTNLIA